MTRAPEIWRQLDQAKELPEVLDAAYSAFAEMLRLIRDHEDSEGPFYGALIMAAAAAADGMGAIAAAPSLPSAVSSHSAELVVSSMNPLDPAASLAALSKLVGSRLLGVVLAASSSGDRRACEDGIRYADEVYALTAGQAK